MNDEPCDAEARMQHKLQSAYSELLSTLDNQLELISDDIAGCRRELKAQVKAGNYVTGKLMAWAKAEAERRYRQLLADENARRKLHGMEPLEPGGAS